MFYNKNNYVVIYIVAMEKKISYCEISIVILVISMTHVSS